MIRTIAALLLAGTAGASGAPPAADSLNSSECLAARAELEQALAEPASARQAHPQRLLQARRQATTACLGRDSPGRERSGAPEPAQSVPAPTIAPRPAQAPAAVAAQPQPPLPIPRAAVITTCDPAGCWDSEGRRLNNMGPLIVGPRGLCSMQGGQLNCP
jgi:hypothetical protein